MDPQQQQMYGTAPPQAYDQSYYDPYNQQQQYPYANYPQFYPNYQEPTAIHPPGVQIPSESVHFVPSDQHHHLNSYYPQPQVAPVGGGGPQVCLFSFNAILSLSFLLYFCFNFCGYLLIKFQSFFMGFNLLVCRSTYLAACYRYTTLSSCTLITNI